MTNPINYLFRVWKVKFVGESVDDCGGGYSESIAEMCDELVNLQVFELLISWECFFVKNKNSFSK